MSEESHILSIRSHRDDVTLFITPAKERGMVNLRMVAARQFGQALDCLVPADSLHLAARAIRDIINEEAEP